MEKKGYIEHKFKKKPKTFIFCGVTDHFDQKFYQSQTRNHELMKFLTAIL